MGGIDCIVRNDFFHLLTSTAVDKNTLCESHHAISLDMGSRHGFWSHPPSQIYYHRDDEQHDGNGKPFLRKNGTAGNL